MKYINNEEAWKFANKWSRNIQDRGFTMIPNLLLEYYADLNFSPPEFLIFVTIESYRWSDELPYPSVEELSWRLGMSTRNITRHITSMQDKGLIVRIKRKGTSNAYAYDALVSTLDGLANNVRRKRQNDTPGGELSSQEHTTSISPKEDTVKQDELNNTQLNNTSGDSDINFDEPFDLDEAWRVLFKNGEGEVK